MSTHRNLPPDILPGDVSVGTPSPRADPSPAEARIEDYLDHLCAPLVGRMPYPQRQALRAEARQHLDMRIAAYTELGSAPDEAVEQALKQFGDPGDLARQWVLTCQGRGADSLSVEAPLGAAFGWFALATLGVIAGTFVKPTAGFWTVMGLCAPLWAGLLTGLLSRGRHAMGTFYALAILIPLTIGVGYVLPIVPDPAGDGLSPLPIIQFVLWMPLGCAAAAAGGWLQGVRDRLRRPLAWE
jgi:hypothetical protein